MAPSSAEAPGSARRGGPGRLRAVVTVAHLTFTEARRRRILAAALIIFEVFAPGAFFLWLGIAAAVVGVLVLVSPGMGWEFQVLIFSVLSVISIIVWRGLWEIRARARDLNPSSVAAS